MFVGLDKMFFFLMLDFIVVFVSFVLVIFLLVSRRVWMLIILVLGELVFRGNFRIFLGFR